MGYKLTSDIGNTFIGLILSLEERKVFSPRKWMLLKVGVVEDERGMPWLQRACSATERCSRPTLLGRQRGSAAMLDSPTSLTFIRTHGNSE